MTGNFWTTVGGVTACLAIILFFIWVFTDRSARLRRTGGIGAIILGLVAASLFVTGRLTTDDEVQDKEHFAWLSDIIRGDRSNMPICSDDGVISTISYSWDTKTFDYDWTLRERAKTVESVDYIIVYSNAYQIDTTYVTGHEAYRRQLRFRIFTLCPYEAIAFNKFLGAGEPWPPDYEPNIDWFSDWPDEDAAWAWLEETVPH